MALSSILNWQVEREEFFGHKFNKDGKLQDSQGKPYLYNYYDDPILNQKRYEEISKEVTDFIYKLMVEVYGLSRICIPKNSISMTAVTKEAKVYRKPTIIKIARPPPRDTIYLADFKVSAKDSAKSSPD
ncbi:hypothetical protein HELRODRAFT_181265 [Helobdella robusta]|uniref:Uncharacterized protein n=1 Tax=Helobdella robusta TaxID=6412 RepID=T1FGT4_HELRO|nr:hypothetical protein HELRODRAFT_181265 [Helobdella robusta]ESN93156.1 hypothetical protein HELRODRAFT_181265 [Helobdella robusta]